MSARTLDLFGPQGARLAKQVERFASAGVGNRYARLTQLMNDGAWHGVHELMEAAGHRFGAYLYDLRHKAGWVVEKRTVAANVYQYRRVLK